MSYIIMHVSITVFILMFTQVHGGIKEEEIIDFINMAENVAKENKENSMDTVVFFDEANTTDAIGLIKEIMCDRRIHGRPVSMDLKFIAACNPYRRLVSLFHATSLEYMLYCEA